MKIPVRYIVTFTVQVDKPLGRKGEEALVKVVEQVIDGERKGGLPFKYDVTNVQVNEEGA